jgi:hypothetical protein
MFNGCVQGESSPKVLTTTALDLEEKTRALVESKKNKRRQKKKNIALRREGVHILYVWLAG